MLLFYILTLAHLILYKSKSKIFLFLSFLALLIIVGYRDLKVGTDTVNYFLYFQSVQNGFYHSGYEPLWKLLNIVVSKFGGDFDTLKICAGLLTLIPIYIGIYKTSKRPFFSLFIYLTFYYFFYSLNIVRQCIAMSWIFLALVNFKEKDWDKKSFAKFLLFFLIAVFFHYSSLIMLLILAVYFGTIKYGKWAVIQVASILIGVIFGSVLFNFASTYLLTNYNNFDAKEDTIGTLINVLILNVAFIFVKKVVVVKDKWLSFFFAFIIFSNLMVRIPFANRFVMFAGITLCIFLPNLLTNVKFNKRLVPLVWILIVLYSYFRFIRTVGGGEILPYYNVLF